MDNEFLAIAVVRPFEDREADVLALLRDFYAMLVRKGYCRDELFKSRKDPTLLINLRYWKSNEALREAAEDPDVHRYWHALSEMAEIEKVYEQLHPIVP
jgi:quinol monooxygenase YgiN